MYKAICVRLSCVRKHPNADKLNLATVCGEQVVVGLEHQDGELGVYFQTDGQLSEEFATINDLVARVDDKGNRAGGFFRPTRQVRAQNFRGAKSDGFWCPLSFFEYTGVVPVEGQEFDTLGGRPICNKYVTPATAKAARGGGMLRRKCVNFPEHIDTEQLAKVSDRLALDGLCIQTTKLHGTSQRIGYVLDDVPIKRTILDRLLRRQRYKQEYRQLIGTRRTILKDRDQKGFYGDEEFRWIAVRDLSGRLQKGEILYGEVVGYTTSGKPIMSPHGDVVYHYGCRPGECRFYVYRITQNGVELPWFEVVRRCEELGIPTVPVEAVCLNGIPADKPEWHINHGHVREGRVLRFESPSQGYHWVKDKTYEFKVLEGIIKQDDNYVDTEEIA